MADWYYSEGEDQKGPVSEDRLRDLIVSGRVRPSDSAWRQGMGDWAPISSIPELMPTGVKAERRDDRPRDDREAQRGRDDRERGRDDDYDDRRRRDADERDRDVRRRPRPKKVTIWAIILIADGGLWLINFFLPWWGLRVREPTFDEARGMGADVGRRMELVERESSVWWIEHVGLSKMIALKGDRDIPVSITLLGLHTGTGLFAFIVSLLILGAVITSLFVGVLAEWRWTGAFLFALLGLILLIFGMLWLFGAPEQDVPPFLSQ